MMRFISTRTHGVLDYLVGALLIVAPYLLGFADGTAAQWVPQILGAGAILYSLFTNYELGAVRVIPMPVHLALDIGSGVLLAASPWLFGFADRVFWPHLILGLAEIGAGLMTRTVPGVGTTMSDDRTGTLNRHS
ncbi:MAG TPA: SPW repeat protein [Falsiroseomonas sp.]|nr:SPW repeat protein [Falsiroseomonas sp.]